MNSTKQMMNFLYENRGKDLPAFALAEVFDRLIWCLSDNGEEIVKNQHEWLKSEELEKVKIALEMKSVFPFASKSLMNEALSSIATKWPELNEKCDEYAAVWKRIK